MLQRCEFTEAGFAVMEEAVERMGIDRLYVEDLADVFPASSKSRSTHSPRPRVMDREETFAAVLRLIANNTTLKHLTVHAGCISVDTEVGSIISALQRSKITNLFLYVRTGSDSRRAADEALIARLHETKLDSLGLSVSETSQSLVDSLVRNTSLRQLELSVRDVEGKDLSRLCDLVARTTTPWVKIFHNVLLPFHTDRYIALSRGLFTVALMKSKYVDALEPKWIAIPGTCDVRNAVRTLLAKGTLFERLPTVIKGKVLRYATSKDFLSEMRGAGSVWMAVVLDELPTLSAEMWAEMTMMTMMPPNEDGVDA